MNTRDPADGSGSELAVRLADVARELHEQDDPQRTLDSIVAAAVGTIPGAVHAGVMVVDQGEVRTVAVTGEVPAAIDQAQYETGQGPCLQALLEQNLVSTPDLDSETRWPAFAARARASEVSSMLSFRLYARGSDVGALNLYASTAHAFDEESEHVGRLFAEHAAVALANAQQRAHLAEAVRTRDLIGQAKGILMERHKLTADQAFTLLVRASQRTNSKLRDLAEELTTTGSLTVEANRRA
ncbi:GAF and ANTAR domain-containing protein [Actinosynnema sp. NPDC047251]|uniref:Response regulator receiver and ANTAR domain protein n=1 Tax=Saccharothrix espanaensis (strain ATCC 51144 / DSM 44229 / JCM 9112 / NBRC 15066 / NRRL 15764) TaxID=1179773 RepID=K0JVL0_SACES|nr:GAF and ANTAR domain-containing protein [Saccharothrix espanaensis]CCH29512.1 Response regulator receiver and ANTAR domain protein [Saccharothrix espanaensis DSM 44229]